MRQFLNFFFELKMLQRFKRSGLYLKGMKNPESVAEHSLRVAQIGYVLAYLEHHPDPNQIATMLIFHDIGECRIGDINKVSNVTFSVMKNKWF